LKGPNTVRAARQQQRDGFLIILDEGGLREGWVKSAYSSLAATAGPQNHNKQRHQATQAETVKPADIGGTGRTRPPVPPGCKFKMVSGRLQNQNKRFRVPIDMEFFRARKLRFLKNTFNTTTQHRISRRAFWLIQKNSQLFHSGVNRKKALTPSLIELETSK
jgi:hypothetical protein